ncbi:hypothetical protein RhiirC2_784529 [Rhizophagus irregularis]|uniref:Uncharacterized protein n=1 Tax=Rhizophagus irregularis TaxID=588596 RepID=A0A2N1MYC4_9GLOM|nr:hypothetical protein RhiirC2_784529 [Rhizophagus irregularis]
MSRSPGFKRGGIALTPNILKLASGKNSNVRVNTKAQANPDPIHRIINDYLPTITNRLQQIRQHTEKRVSLTPGNLDNPFDLRTLRQNLANVTAERDQFQNLLQDEIQTLTALRDRMERLEEMYTRALTDERNARREN